MARRDKMRPDTGARVQLDRERLASYSARGPGQAKLARWLAHNMELHGDFPEAAGGDDFAAGLMTSNHLLRYISVELESIQGVEDAKLVNGTGAMLVSSAAGWHDAMEQAAERGDRAEHERYRLLRDASEIALRYLRDASPEELLNDVSSFIEGNRSLVISLNALLSRDGALALDEAIDLAGILICIGDPGGAVDALRTVDGWENDGEILFMMAAAEMERKAWKEAWKVIGLMDADHPERPYLEGEVHRGEGRLGLAHSRFSEYADRGNGKHLEAARTRIAELVECVREAAGARSMDPVSFLETDAAYGQALELLGSGDAAGAGKMLEGLRTIMPGDPALETQYATALILQARFVDARAVLEAVLEERPDHPVAARNLAALDDIEASYLEDPEYLRRLGAHMVSGRFSV